VSSLIARPEETGCSAVVEADESMTAIGEIVEFLDCHTERVEKVLFRFGADRGES
jgi:hypothetical protein